MSKGKRSKKKTQNLLARRSDGLAEHLTKFDPIQWLIDTRPATASWLGHDLTKARIKQR